MTPDGVAWPEVLRSMAAQLAWFQTALLGAAAVDKIVRWQNTRRVARRFAGIPHGLTGWAAAVVVSWELVAAVALVLPRTRMAGAVGAALLWSIYLGLLLRALRSDRRDVDCGCSFGSPAGTPAGGGHRPVGAFQILRNVALIAMAWGVAAVSARGSIDAAASQVLAAGALLALYVALDQVMTLRPMRSGEVL